MADSLGEVAAQPGIGGKATSMAWWTAKKAMFLSPLIGVFALAAAPATAGASLAAAAPGVGAAIKAGEIGLFEAGAKVAEYGIKEFIPFVWNEGLPAIWEAAKTSLSAGGAGLSELLAEPS